MLTFLHKKIIFLCCYKGFRAGGGVLRIAPKLDKQNYQFQFTSNLLSNLITDTNASSVPLIESVIPYVEPGTESSYYTITSFETKAAQQTTNSNPTNNSKNATNSNSSSGSSSGNSDVNMQQSKTLNHNKQRIIALYQRIRENELENSKSFILPEERQKSFFDEKDRQRQKTPNETLTEKIKETRSRNPNSIDQPSLTSFITSNHLIGQSLKNSNSNAPATTSTSTTTNSNRQLAKIKNLNKQLQMQHQEFFYPDLHANSSELLVTHKNAAKKHSNIMVDVVNTKNNTITHRKMDKSDSMPVNKVSKRLDDPNLIVENNAPRSSPNFLNVINHRIKFQVAN